jgi:hypothetical protein
MKKLIAAGGVALGLAGFGLFGGIAQALADSSGYEDSGTFDEMVEVHDGQAIADMIDDDGIQGSDNVVSPVAWTPGPITGLSGGS